jgi:heat shock protein HslJ
MITKWIRSFVLFCLVGGLLAACSPLSGTDWTLESLNGDELIPGTTITISFDSKYMKGNAGCNCYNHEVKLHTDGTITFVNGLVYDLLCTEPDGVMDQETKYLHLLGSAVSYSRSNGYLEMKNANGDTVLLFKKDLPENYSSGCLR